MPSPTILHLMPLTTQASQAPRSGTRRVTGQPIAGSYTEATSTLNPSYASSQFGVEQTLVGGLVGEAANSGQVQVNGSYCRRFNVIEEQYSSLGTELRAQAPSVLPLHLNRCLISRDGTVRTAYAPVAEIPTCAATEGHGVDSRHSHLIS